MPQAGMERAFGAEQRPQVLHNGRRFTWNAQTDQPPITASRYAIIGEIKYENVEGTGYLEMWSHFPNAGKYFTRTLAPPGSSPMAVITGASDWRPFTLPFNRSNTTEPVSKLEVNLHLPAKGVVYLRGLRLVEDPGAKP